MPAQPEKNEKEILNELFKSQDEGLIKSETEPVLDKEVESYIEKVEKEVYLSQPITDDSGQVLVSSPVSQQPLIVLPLTDSEYQFGLGQKVSESIRWLSEWCFRLVKIFGPRAHFRKAEGR